MFDVNTSMNFSSYPKSEKGGLRMFSDAVKRRYSFHKDNISTYSDTKMWSITNNYVYMTTMSLYVYLIDLKPGNSVRLHWEFVYQLGQVPIIFWLSKIMKLFVNDVNDL